MAAQTIGIDEYVPERALDQVSISLTTTAIDLGGESGNSIRSHAGFDLWCAGDWYIGDAAGQARLVVGGEAFSLPSGSLSGAWAKAASGTVSLVVTAARKATP